MRLLVLVLLGVACLAVIHPAEASRSKRTIGSWISKMWKRWKKEPEQDYDYHQPIYTVMVPQPIYHAPAPQPHYPPPVHHQPSYHAPPVQHHGGYGTGGHGIGGHGAGGHGIGGHGAGGHGIGGHGSGGYGKGGHGAGGHGIGGHGAGGHGIGGHGAGGHGSGGYGTGGHGAGGHGIGGHGAGGHGIGGHGAGGHGKGGHGAGGHGKGGHGAGGHGKGGGGIPHGFGPVKHSDVLHAGQSYHGPPPSVSYSAPAPVNNYGPSPAPSYAPPPSVSYNAPGPADSYSPPQVLDSYSAPSAPISAPVVAPFSAPVVAPFSAPVIAPVVQDIYSPPVVSEPSNDYRAPPSFPPPMAAHGSSSSSYLEGSFQPSHQLPLEPALPAPPAPLYDLPIGPGDIRAVHDGAPAPVEVQPPAPLALENTFEEPRSVGGNFRIVSGGIGGGSIGGDYSAPALDFGSGSQLGAVGPALQSGDFSEAAFDFSYASQLGADDPIIEIVFQDGDPAPPQPPPIIDPELFALTEDDVEVYFIEYGPEDNLDDLAALRLDGAQPGILHDLPQELPVDIRSQLLGSGILENADIQVIDLQDALSQNILDIDTRTALEAAFSAESRIHETRVDAPEQNVELRVHRLMSDKGSPSSTAELLAKLQGYREGRYIGLVKTSGSEANKYLPLTVDGEKLPLPNILNLENQKVTEVLVVADNEDDGDDDDDDDDEQSPPPANSSDPEHNLVAQTSELHPVIVPASEAIEDGVDRQWHGDPNDWRPVWN